MTEINSFRRSLFANRITHNVVGEFLTKFVADVVARPVRAPPASAVSGRILGSVPCVPSVTGETGHLTRGAVSVFCIPA